MIELRTSCDFQRGTSRGVSTPGLKGRQQQLFPQPTTTYEKLDFSGSLPEKIASGKFPLQNTNFVASQREYYWVDALPPLQEG